jgi:hypothetical protein
VAIRFGVSSTVKNRLPRYSNFWDGTAVFSPFTATGSYDALATYTVPSGGVSEIIFSGLPTGGQYSHLQIRGIGFGSGSSPNWYDAFMQFNGDTGSTYDYHALDGDGTSASAAASINRSNMIVGYFGGVNVSGIIIDILDYANTSKNKTVRALTGLNQNNANDRGILLVSNLWRNTSAINSIRIFPSSGTISQYSQFSVYGVRG